MQCLECKNNLTGRQTKFCSQKCKNNYCFHSGRLVNLQKRLAYNRKITLINMFGGSCQKCGYNKCLRALAFHHLDKSTKKFSLGHHVLQSKSWDSILEEVKKCSLLCCNCHNETHAEEDKTYQFFIEEKIYKGRPPKKLKERRIIIPYNCEYCKKEFMPLTKFSKFCSLECSGFTQRKVTWPTKEQLIEDIRNMPFTKVGQKYKVSDNAVRKWAKKYNIIQ